MSLRYRRNLRLLILMGGAAFLFHVSFRQLPATKITIPVELPQLTIPSANGLPAFYPSLDAFPWDNFTQTVQLRQRDAISIFSSSLLLWLTPYLLLEPKTPINASCSPPPLELPLCTHNGNSSQPRSKPRKVGILIQFAFGVDILEIYLNEVYDVVDKFFLLESSHSYTYVFKKRQLWERAKDQSRFAKFADKIVHFVLDDADAALMQKLPKPKGYLYAAEFFQEEARWKKFLKWNEVTKLFGDEDVLGFGDTDEIPARHILQYLKYCDLPSDPVDVATWALLGNVSQAVKIDWSVKGHPFLLGDPSFWSLGTARNKGVRFTGYSSKVPSRTGGRSASFLIGGTHMSDYPYIPHCLAKRLTHTEQDLEFIEAVASYPSLRKNMSVPELEAFYASVSYNRFWPGMKFNLREVPQKDLDDMYLPWFYECNRQRYPALEGKHDPRLD